MSYSNFHFLQGVYPDLYKWAALAERHVAEEPLIAMINLKRLVLGITDRIAGKNGIAAAGDLLGDGLLHSLRDSKMLTEDLFLAAREMMLFDERESELMVEEAGAERLLYRAHDFAVWFFRTYVDSTHVQPPYVNVRRAQTELAVPQQNKRMNETAAEMDGIATNTQWGKGLVGLPGFKSLHFENGEKYEGQLLKGLRHGQGIYTWRDGTVYSGTWHRDLEHGCGEKRYANGDKYSGSWKNGMYDGQGTYTWRDGSSYAGRWQDGMEHGMGTKTEANGLKKTGFWTYGELVTITDHIE